MSTITKDDLRGAIRSTVDYWQGEMAAAGGRVQEGPYADEAIMIDILMLEGVQLAQKAGVEWVEAVPEAPEFAKQFNLATKVNKWCGRGIHPRWIDSEGNEYAWSELGFATHLLD